MSDTQSSTVSLNLDGTFAAEAARASAASERLAATLGVVDAKAAKAEKSLRDAAIAARLAAQTNNGSFTSRTRSSALDKESPWARDAAKRRSSAAPAGPRATAAPGGGGEDEGGGAGGIGKSLKYIAKQAGIGRAALAALGVAGTLELAKLAMGYRGMAQLQALGMRAQMQMRQLFRGVDPSPVIRAFDRFTQLVNPATASGKALSEMFGRIFNGLFGAVERVEPVLRGLFKGLLIYGQEVEIAYLRARIALVPMQVALENLGKAMGFDGSPIELIGSAATAAAIPLKVVVAYVETLAAGFAVAAAAAARFNTALGGVPADVIAKIPAARRAIIAAAANPGAIGVRVSEAMKGPAEYRDGPISVPEGTAAPGGEKATKARVSGAATGAAYAAGMAEGADAGAPSVDAAGQRLAGALDKGVRTKGKIQSPSKLARDTAREYPRGAVQGIDEGAADVQAAGGALVPKMGVAGGGGGAPGGARAGITIGSLTVQVTVAGGANVEADARRGARAGVVDGLREMAQQLGVSVELAA